MKNNYVKKSWKSIKDNLNSITELYNKQKTRELLLDNDYYKQLYGRAKNRTLIKENPVLYNSIYKHTEILETTFKNQNSYKGMYSFSNRIKFIVERNYDIESMKCSCGRKYTWNTYCRKCPDYHKTMTGKKMNDVSKMKCRVSTFKYLSNVKGQIVPRYNVKSIPLIEEYGERHGYNFQHAENGGEFYIKELGYFLDAYDQEKNVVLEIDEKHHFDQNGKLRKKDLIRQKEIIDFLGCEFKRIKFDE